LAVETVYIVQSFQPGRGARPKSDPPSAYKTQRQAQRVADRLASTKVGVVLSLRVSFDCIFVRL
jgi:hypothetical protein